MLYSTPVTLAILLGLGAFAIYRYRTLWSWRTALLLASAGVLVILVDVVNLPATSAIQVGTVFGVGSVILMKNEALSALTAADRAFVNAYAAMRIGLRDLRGGISTMDPVENLQELDRIAAALDETHAPDMDWAGLKDDAVRELHWRRDTIAAGQPVSDSVVAEAKERWEVLERRLAETLREKSNFWLLWPWP